MATVKGLMLLNDLKIAGITAMNSGGIPVRPRIAGNCSVVTTMDSPPKNPNAIGIDTKSNMNPRLNIPNIRDQIPTQKDKAPDTIAGGMGTPCALLIPRASWAVNVAVVVVGPVLISRGTLDQN